MSNDVDVLLVGGGAHARVLCVPRPVAPKIAQEEATYQTRVYTNLDGQKFHIATPVDGEQPTDGYIDGTIFALQFPPAWDLQPDPPISGVL